MSPVNSLWFKWKSLRLPWRKSFLVGSDLKGNTYWEFKDALNANRFRRIVKFDPKTHYADVQVNPQWHQWLRHVREKPPSIEEQKADILRQMQMKQLARLADERWASKPSYLDMPKTQAPDSATDKSGAALNQAPTKDDTAQPSPATTPDQQGDDAPTAAKEKNPWVQAQGGPSENWQPETWTPKPTKR